MSDGIIATVPGVDGCILKERYEGDRPKMKGFAFTYARNLRIARLALGAVGCFLFLAASVHAATYTVKAGGGGNYTTIQACANAMGNGDTCVVYAGTYNENVTVPAGSAGSYKTLTVNSGDTVYVYSFTINSHVKINGFHIQNPSSPHSHSCVSIMGNATDFYITNNNMYACGSRSMIDEPDNYTGTGHGFIQGNTLSYSCSTSSAPDVCRGMTINGSYHLIENNNISHVSDGIYLFGLHNVVRKNTFHNLNISDCGSNSSNCHIDFVQADAVTSGGATMPAEYDLFEANTIRNMVGGNTHGGYLLQAESCNGQCYNAIIRLNVGAHIGGGGILDDNSFTAPPAWDNVKSYNNSWVDYNNQNSGAGKGTNAFTHGSTGGAEINDLFYYPESLSDFNPYFTDSASAPFVAKNNLAYCTGSCGIHGQVYGSGNFTDDPGNIVADPQFVNYAQNDFHLSSGSPALGAGTYLTTVASSDSGSGASLVVKDAGFFQDGSGIAGVKGDCIAVTTTTNHVCITAVNYSTNTLTLSASITRSPGAPVWLYSDSSGSQVLFGSAPNIGALNTSSGTTASSPAPPIGLTGTVQ